MGRRIKVGDLFECRMDLKQEPTIITMGDLPLCKDADKIPARAARAAHDFAEGIWWTGIGAVVWFVQVTHQKTKRQFQINVSIEVEPSFYTEVIKEITKP